MSLGANGEIDGSASHAEGPPFERPCYRHQEFHDRLRQLFCVDGPDGTPEQTNGQSARFRAKDGLQFYGAGWRVPSIGLA